MAFTINRLDHLVLTVRSIEKTVKFYQTVLGMQSQTFGEGRIALRYGTQKINLHLSGAEFEPKAGSVQAGSADLCFIIDSPLAEARLHLQQCGIVVLDGPVTRTGALGVIESLYIRDPDNNLIELSRYLDEAML